MYVEASRPRRRFYQRRNVTLSLFPSIILLLGLCVSSYRYRGCTKTRALNRREVYWMKMPVRFPCYFYLFFFFDQRLSQHLAEWNNGHYMEHSRASIAHTFAEDRTCALRVSQRDVCLGHNRCVRISAKICVREHSCRRALARSLARQTAVRTIIPGARSHNALRTIVGIPLSGLEWFIHVDQLFS